MRTALTALALALGFLSIPAWAQVEVLESKLIPIPVYATSPNEGNTFGFMPVILVVDPETSKTSSIWAPSYTFNQTIRNTGTFRWYHYPSEHQSLTLTAGASTHVNYGGLMVWDNRPLNSGAWTDNVFFRWGRDIFYRFFGFGPDTTAGMESSHTQLREDFRYRRGWNLEPHLNLGGTFEYFRNLIEPIGVPCISLSTEAFPDAPGIHGATVSSEAIDLRYDTRDQGDYSTDGIYVDWSIGRSQGISQSPSFWSTRFEFKSLIDEAQNLQGGLRFFSSYVTRSDVPFYQQSSLGGSVLMRGFTQDRFIAQGAWVLELEQRIRVLQRHIYGVTSDWRIDPFFSIGQVYGQDRGPLSHLRESGGLGFRAWVRPNVLGRVDIGITNEGVSTYVELGYPF